PASCSHIGPASRPATESARKLQLDSDIADAVRRVPFQGTRFFFVPTQSFKVDRYAPGVTMFDPAPLQGGSSLPLDPPRDHGQLEWSAVIRAAAVPRTGCARTCRETAAGRAAWAGAA